MYEDAEIELGAFEPGGRIFCIASAGCTAMRLAAHHKVVAVDINPVQLAYVQRRLDGASVQRGSAERILDFARTLAPIAGWNRRTVRAFLDLDDPKQQIPIGGTIWIRGDFVPPLLFYSRGSSCALFIPLHFSIVCPQTSEVYCEPECSAVSSGTPTAAILTRMHCFSERCALHRRFLNSNRFNFDAPTRPIFSNTSQPGASLGSRFRTFWMGPTQRTSGD